MSFYLLDNAQPNTQQWGYPRRGASLSGTCIIHTAECALDLVGEDTSAEGTAEFIRTRSDYGSYHTLVDSDSIIEMAPYEYETWQDSQTNPWAVGLSAACQADGWHLIPADRRDRIYRNLAWAAADFVTYMATKGITVPLRRITGAEARARVPGFCAHGDSGVDRHDPGPAFDWALFFKYTSQALGGVTITTQSTTSTPAKSKPVTDPLEEIMAYYTDRADFEAWQRRIVREEIAKAGIPKSVWDHGTTAADGKTKTPMHRALRDPLNALVAAVAAEKGLSAEQLTTIIEEAIAKSVVSVDVTVNGKDAA